MTLLVHRMPHEGAAGSHAASAPPVVVTTRGAALDFAIVRDRSGLEDLCADWTDLFARHGAPHQVFQTYAWSATWARIYLDAHTRLAIVIGRLDGRVVLIWPLVERRLAGLRILTGLGEPTSQYSDMLVTPAVGQAGVAAALAFVRRQRVDAVALRRVRGDSALAPVLARSARIVERAAAPFVDFEGLADTAAFAARFSGKLRATRRRRRRLAEARGPLTVSVYRASPEAAAHVATAFAFKRAWARGRGEIAPALFDPRFERFFAAAALGGPMAPDLRACVVRSAGAVVAVELAAVCKGWHFGHVLAPDPASPIAGLGGLLAETTLTTSIEEGALGYDLLAPADSYKREWTAHSIEVCDYAIARTIVGRLYAFAWLGVGRSRIKALVKRLRPLRAGRRASPPPRTAEE